MIGSSTAHNVNTQTLCLMHHEVITSSTPTTIRLVITDGQCRTHVSVIVGFHFWGAFTQRISFSTLHLMMLYCRPHWSQSILHKRRTLADSTCKQHHSFYYLLDKCVSIHPSFGMLADCAPKYIRFNALARQHKVAVHTERTSAAWDLPTAQYMMRGEQRIVTSVSPHHSVAS